VIWLIEPAVWPGRHSVCSIHRKLNGPFDLRLSTDTTNNMKTPAGRARKIAALVAMLARGETVIPQRPRVVRRVRR
jgi:hypothetical protein